MSMRLFLHMNVGENIYPIYILLQTKNRIKQILQIYDYTV